MHLSRSNADIAMEAARLTRGCLYRPLSVESMLHTSGHASKRVIELSGSEFDLRKQQRPVAQSLIST